jgi:hypothetical protein
VGFNIKGGVTSNSTAAGQINNTRGSSGLYRPVGGLAGANTVTITDANASGGVNGSDTAGGLVGNNSGTVNESYFDKEATGQSTSAGSAENMTTAQMQESAAEDNMGGFDFGVAWETQTNPDDYPTLIALTQDTDTRLDSISTAAVTVENQSVLNGSTTVTVKLAQFGNDSMLVRILSW